MHLLYFKPWKTPRWLSLGDWRREASKERNFALLFSIVLANIVTNIDLIKLTGSFKAACTLIRGSSFRGGRDPVASATGRSSPVNGAAANNQPGRHPGNSRGTRPG
jgi:hypothetical protein